MIRWMGILASLGLWLAMVVPGWAGDDLAQRVAGHVSVGEFSPALRLAEQAPSADERDRLLSQIAQAQAAVGAAEPAAQALAQVRDDAVRTRLIRTLPLHPAVLPQILPGRQEGGFIGSGAGVFSDGNQPNSRGGSPTPDFDSITELVTSTVAPPSWDDVGGPGSIRGFANGVLVDAQGTLRRVVVRDPGGDLSAVRLAALESHAAATNATTPLRPSERLARSDPRVSSPLRKISLTRLERQLQLDHAAGRRPTEAMRVLAGLSKLQYIFAYPEQGEIILAGPAGDWTADREGRIVRRDDGRPVLQLDDLVVLLRHLTIAGETGFGCTINPTAAGLAKTQALLAESQRSKLDPQARDAWLEKVRATLGKQDVVVFGLDPRTRVARTIVEADYRMKLVGMGLEEGVLGVKPYLETLDVRPGQPLPPMDVLRWWFTLHYDAVRSSPEHDAFSLEGPGCRVLSENQFVTERGERVGTGASTDRNRQFAESFTKHFAALAQRHPIYADLQNLCDLALACAILRTHELPRKVGWQMPWFGDAKQCPVAHDAAPKQVDTVIAHRVVHRSTILAGVSGGVQIDTQPWLKSEKHYGRLTSQRTSLTPPKLPVARWWWD